MNTEELQFEERKRKKKQGGEISTRSLMEVTECQCQGKAAKASPDVMSVARFTCRDQTGINIADCARCGLFFVSLSAIV